MKVKQFTFLSFFLIKIMQLSKNQKKISFFCNLDKKT
jgi:hypothetical protein